MWGDNTILECDPPRRFVHTWRSLYDDEMAAEDESRVTWEIEPGDGGTSRLTLIHDRLEGAPKTAASVDRVDVHPEQPEDAARDRRGLPRRRVGGR